MRADDIHPYGHPRAKKDVHQHILFCGWVRLPSLGEIRSAMRFAFLIARVTIATGLHFDTIQFTRTALLVEATARHLTANGLISVAVHMPFSSSDRISRPHVPFRLPVPASAFGIPFVACSRRQHYYVMHPAIYAANAIGKNRKISIDPCAKQRNAARSRIGERTASDVL